ncbi:hypothetical protein EYF80_058690 [Liparis tanakae]|uniref:Uncharacterized protein n=1 Tax=Liparis tanakae TaxID=230148 RepID=A0A4Z2EQE1_9TELE|nr:hypothetical protein EYF80_058690 [Liparis tanakae]
MTFPEASNLRRVALPPSSRTTLAAAFSLTRTPTSDPEGLAWAFMRTLLSEPEGLAWAFMRTLLSDPEGLPAAAGKQKTLFNMPRSWTRVLDSGPGLGSWTRVLDSSPGLGSWVEFWTRVLDPGSRLGSWVEFWTRVLDPGPGLSSGLGSWTRVLSPLGRAPVETSPSFWVRTRWFLLILSTVSLGKNPVARHDNATMASTLELRVNTNSSGGSGRRNRRVRFIVTVSEELAAAGSAAREPGIRSWMPSHFPLAWSAASAGATQTELSLSMNRKLFPS